MKLSKAISSILFLSLASITLISNANEANSDEQGVYTEKKFTAPIGALLSVETGEAIFTEGTVIEGKSIEIQDSKELMIAGAMFIPFPVKIEKGELRLIRFAGKWSYFCADEGRASASFPGLGSVIREGDCVGIRVENKSEKMEWVVDNSHYNRGMQTIYTKSIPDEDTTKYLIKTSAEPFKVKSLKVITFDGFNGGQLHFTLTEMKGRNKDSKEFTFDFKGEPTVVSIKGNVFKVLEANNVNASYEWIKIKE